MRHGRGMTLALSTLLAVVLVGGAGAAWAFGRQHDRTPAAVVEHQPGPTADSTVRLSTDAAHHPRSADVRSLLQGYFDAINTRIYGGWSRAVSAAQSAPQAEPQWARDYSTTVDSNLTVVMVGDDPLRARMMFSSQQAPGLAPPALPVACIDWDLTYLLEEENGRLVINGLDPSAQSMRACG